MDCFLLLHFSSRVVGDNSNAIGVNLFSPLNLFWQSCKKRAVDLNQLL